MPRSKRAIERGQTIEGLQEERDKLQAALSVEQAAALVASHALPPSFVQVLVGVPVEEMPAKAERIRAELAERGFRVGAPSSPDQERAESPVGDVDTEPPGAGPSRVSGPEEEFSEPPNFEALAATDRSGPEGGSPPDPGPSTPKDRRSQAIRSAGSWEELEQAVQPTRR